MNRPRPSRELRERVTERARRRCEYCRCPLDFSTEENFDVEHVLPVQAGGALWDSNLAVSCSGCNGAKGIATEANDPETQAQVPLFHPRQMRWQDHFSWEGVMVFGLTATGRATIERLRLNRRGVLNQRRLLTLVDLQSPLDD